MLRYTSEWERYVTRQARWVDFANDYKTLDLPYMESVMWAFKTLWDKGLVYEGFRVLPYCWNDETPLSNHELRMDDDVYRSRQDQTGTVAFPRLRSGRVAELCDILRHRHETTVVPGDFFGMPGHVRIGIGAMRPPIDGEFDHWVLPCAHLT